MSLVERERESLVMERKWNLVEEKKGKKIGKQNVTCWGRGSITRNLKKRVSTLTKSLQEGSDQDDLIGEPIYLLRKPNLCGRRGPRSDEHLSLEVRGEKQSFRIKKKSGMATERHIHRARRNRRVELNKRYECDK